jgi:butyryl-CoA dehydrogenase
VTEAIPQEDGTYKIVGHKIFISAGDHQCADNIVHLVLARITGAPQGTKGISLFVVPKKRVENESLVYNDVSTAGEFEKMGQRGYVTAHLVFGDKNDCKGWIVGQPNKGLKYMFQMMNGARIEVGLTAAAIASAAYQASLQYAKERPQGRKILSSGEKNVTEEQTLIINHPDVRRMLLLQKAVVDGSTSLLMLCAKYLDLSHYGDSTEQRERYHDLVELLTPIAKTYPSEMGRTATSTGLQVLGGYGFTTDFPLEQLYRDIRITSIYEGTTGIQSLDLLGRKVLMKNGAVLQELMKEINQDVQNASTYDELKPYVNILNDKLGLIQKVLSYLGEFAMKGQYERFLADATTFMEMTSTVIIGWQWIKMATAAKEAIVTDNMIKGREFYEGQIHTLKFYFKYEMPKTNTHAEILLNKELLTIVEEGKEIETFA